MSAHQLRPYQQAAVDSIRFKYAQGIRKVLLWLATGGGKTTVFAHIMGATVARGKRPIMVVRGVQLIEQASKRLFREGIDHGVMQADHWNRNPKAPVQVCSIDTLFRRKIAPPADLVVIDEAHMAGSQGYLWLVEQYPNAFFLPVTATPFLKRGLRHVADDFVYPITIKELTEQGYLSRARYFTPTTPDLKGVRTDSKTGDYVAGDLRERLDNAAIYGDVARNYLEKLKGAPSVLFAVDIKHSLTMVDRLREAGIRAAHVEADTPAAEREKIFADLASGACQIVSNVGVLTTGWDLPELRGVIMCRPTKSLNLYIQMWGRGTRVAPGKNEFLVLDHANNVMTHGFPHNEPELDLDGSKPRDSGEAHPVACEECFGFFDPVEVFLQANPEWTGAPKRSYICPYCGHDNREKGEAYERKRDEAEAELREIGEAEMAVLQIEKDIDRWIETAVRRGYKPGYVFHKIKENYDESLAKKYWNRVKAAVPVAAEGA